MTLATVSLPELRRRRSQKWRACPPDVLPAFVAEMDFALAPPVAAALVEAVELGDCGYAWPSEELGAALAGFAGERFGWRIDPGDVALVPDVMVAVVELLRIALRPGDGVVINTPAYPPFFTHIAEAGCRVVEAPLARDGSGRYELDLDALAAAFAAGARAYLLCNPHNPSGRVLSRAELERVAELAERHGALVLADEIHAPLALPGAPHVPYLSLGEPAVTHGVALVSASKGWNVPGLKCAQAVAQSVAARQLTGAFSSDFLARVGSLGVIATTAAYRDGGPWLDEALTLIDANRQLLAELLAEHVPAARYVPPEGGYLAWIDCRPLHLQTEPADWFLERGRVALGAGPAFGDPGAGHVRLTMATSPALLTEIVGRMRAAL
ncbi:MAG TPA: aminotransferase class I/II-fold pyridoxal phosphate-dependent enzyme [Candidatus Dormibacteraeota bacterium]|nr:aminotransferase class I/II-fold pyridoxal phosphate-dependent enzyme [Candidatus Dormibacteraeota bacterium]